MIILSMVSISFVILKLYGVIPWSWWIVLSPFIPLILWLIDQAIENSVEYCDEEL